MRTVTSKDGTSIAYLTEGTGHPVIFVTGAFNDHTRCADLAAALAGDYRTVTYDRRARGASGDTRPYEFERELDDLAAVIDAAGGSAAVFGYSSGAVIALAAAAAGLPLTRVILFEPPFVADPAAADLPARLQALVDAGRPDDAVSLFQTECIGLPPPVVAGIRESPMFPGLVAVAQSVVYDATIATRYAAPTPAMLAVDVPVLVLNGASTWPRVRDAAHRLAAAMPAAGHEELAGDEPHGIPTEATAEAVRRFLR